MKLKADFVKTEMWCECIGIKKKHKHKTAYLLTLEISKKDYNKLVRIKNECFADLDIDKPFSKFDVLYHYDDSIKGVKS